ncbi:DUF2892 domain-containing protein [Methanolobus sp. ZRKC3]|uniref:YgaP family membrane protein n=1 Tax=Methanolobus sp. ZRKC3 TaxID=3125786 RepID=UPI003250E0A1
MDLSEIFLQENVGGIDLVLRAVMGTIAITALSLDLIESEPWKWVFAFVAIVGLYTSIMRHCSLYPFIKINTAKKQ